MFLVILNILHHIKGGLFAALNTESGIADPLSDFVGDKDHLNLMQEYRFDLLKPNLFANILMQQDFSTHNRGDGMNSDKFTVFLECDYFLYSSDHNESRLYLNQFLKFLSTQENIQVVIVGGFCTNCGYIKKYLINNKIFDNTIKTDKFSIIQFGWVIDILNIIYQYKIVGNKQRFLYFSGKANDLWFNNDDFDIVPNVNSNDLWKQHYCLIGDLEQERRYFNDEKKINIRDIIAESVQDMPDLLYLIEFIKQWQEYCVTKRNEYGDEADWTFEFLKENGKNSKNTKIVCNKIIDKSTAFFR